MSIVSYAGQNDSRSNQLGGQLLCRLIVFLISAAAPLCSLAAESVSFRNEVMPLLARAGCNAGVCHGNLNGKGGFRLSLRGQDPALDFLALTRDQFGRRADRVRPDQSLLLLKPSMQISHEGGRRFPVDSPEYRLLYRWIAAGALDDGNSAPVIQRLIVAPTDAVLIEPDQQVQLSVQAEFDDGSSRDVTSWAVYESSNQHADISTAGLVQKRSSGQTTVLVRYLNQQVPVRVAFVSAQPNWVVSPPPTRNYIDEHVFNRLEALRMNPSPIAGDTVFIRRVYLDLLGQLPLAEQARQFVANDDPEKRSRLIDELLARPKFASHWALRWCDLLRVEEKTLDRKGVSQLHHWLTQQFEHNIPLDKLARALLTAEGSTYLNPPAGFYRALREPTARSESVAQVFLGVRLQCARCHNHPFDRWTQDDYYDWAATFAGIQYKIVSNERRDQNDKHEFVGEQIVIFRDAERVKNPTTNRHASVRFLGEQAENTAAAADRLAALADWLVAPSNPFFARTQANRIWASLLGRGIVDPIDDFRLNNPPSHPALLDALTRDFVEHDYDLRHLIRVIANSSTYQLSSVENESNTGDEVNCAHAVVRRLTAEELLDGLCQVLAVEAKFNGYPAGLSAGELPGVQAVRSRESRLSAADQFLRLFGKPPRLLSCECERSNDVTLGQTFAMISGSWINDQLARPGNRLDALLTTGADLPATIDELFWAVLVRAPTAEEQQTVAEYLSQSVDKRAGLEDVTWGLLNSTEFLLRQ